MPDDADNITFVERQLPDAKSQHACLAVNAVVKLPSHRLGIPKFETTRLYVCQTRRKKF